MQGFAILAEKASAVTQPHPKKERSVLERANARSNTLLSKRQGRGFGKEQQNGKALYRYGTPLPPIYLQCYNIKAICKSLFRSRSHV